MATTPGARPVGGTSVPNRGSGRCRLMRWTFASPIRSRSRRFVTEWPRPTPPSGPTPTPPPASTPSWPRPAVPATRPRWPGPCEPEPGSIGVGWPTTARRRRWTRPSASPAATDLYRRLLARPHVPADVRTKAANNLGIIEVWCGRPERALGWFEAAAVTAAGVGPAAAAFVAAGRAWATVRAGRLTEGLALYDEAAARWRAAGIPTAELFAEYADALADLRLIPEATREARRAVAALDEHGFDLIAAETQLRLARLTLAADNAPSAAMQAEHVAARLRGHGRSHWAARARLVAVEARRAAGATTPADLTVARRGARTLESGGFIGEAVDAHLLVGRVAQDLGRDGAAKASWRRAHSLARDGPLLTRLRGRLAAALAADGDGRAVIAHATAGLNDLDRHRAALTSPELRALASGHGAELGRVGLRAVAARGRPADVFAWMERTRAAATAVVDPADLEGIEQELGHLRAVQSELAAARRDGSASVRALLEQQAGLEERIRRATWTRRRDRVVTGEHRSMTAIRGALGARVLVEYDVLDGRVLAVVLDGRNARLVELADAAAVATEAEALLFALHRLARAGGSSASTAAARIGADAARDALARMVVEPLGLDPAREVVVVPVGMLQRLPWAALHEGPVAVAPSARAWATSAERPARAGTVVLLAGPELPGAIDEVAILARIHPGAVVLTPPSTTVADATVALSDAGLVHLACHGSVRADNPLFSSLLVSDEPLTV